MYHRIFAIIPSTVVTPVVTAVIFMLMFMVTVMYTTYINEINSKNPPNTYTEFQVGIFVFSIFFIWIFKSVEFFSEYYQPITNKGNK